MDPLGRLPVLLRSATLRVPKFLHRVTYGSIMGVLGREPRKRGERIRCAIDVSLRCSL